MKPNVLILCTGNSCRSQMAEGLLRAAAGDIVTVLSAGVKPTGQIHPLALKVMAEVQIDISSHSSKHLGVFSDLPIATIIAVCGHADQTVPLSPRVSRYHWPFRDPSEFNGAEEEALVQFRIVRDEMKRTFDAYAAGLRDGRGLPL